MRGRGPAASADDIHPAVRGKLAQVRRHDFRRFVEPAEGIGQAGVGIAACENRREARKLLDVGAHLLRAQRAVDAHAQQRRARNGNPEGFDGLAGERAAAQVDNGHGSQQGQAFSRVLEILLGGKQRGFAVQRVEDGLHQQQVNAAVHEAADLLVVGVAQLIEGHGARGGARDFLRCRGRAAGGAERARHPARRARDSRS